MKIVVLDGHTLNPGDLSWSALEELGPCEIHDRTAQDEVLDRSREAEILLTNKTILGREVIGQLPALRYIGVLATGHDVVDVEAAGERGIPVANVPDYGTRSVAQMTFALLLELTQKVGHHERTVREGRWSANPDYCYWDEPLVELAGRVMGIVGLGRIGSEVARIARAFGMEVAACTRSLPPDDLSGVPLCGFDELFATSDVVSLHCPLTPETERLADAKRIGNMKRGSYFLNTARGRLVDEAALAAALDRGHLAGAGLDVLSVEPPGPENPLLGASNCVITPHISWATREARSRLMAVAVSNLRAFLEGRPQNVVN